MLVYGAPAESFRFAGLTCVGALEGENTMKVVYEHSDFPPRPINCFSNTPGEINHLPTPSTIHRREKKKSVDVSV